jgi:hypothetical protein
MEPQYAIYHDTPEILDGYTHIAVWDDDVESAGGCGAINRMFETAERMNAWVSGPAFSGDGRISHWNTARNSLLANCWTGFVEARAAGRAPSDARRRPRAASPPPAEAFALPLAGAASPAFATRTAHLNFDLIPLIAKPTNLT